MIDVHTPITVTLTAERWQKVLAVMAEAPMPHRITDPLVREIHQQCLAHDRDNVTQLRDVDAGC